MPSLALTLTIGFWEAIWWQNTLDLNEIKMSSKFFARIHRGSLRVGIEIGIWESIQEQHSNCLPIPSPTKKKGISAKGMRSRHLSIDSGNHIWIQEIIS